MRTHFFIIHDSWTIQSMASGTLFHTDIYIKTCCVHVITGINLEGDVIFWIFKKKYSTCMLKWMKMSCCLPRVPAETVKKKKTKKCIVFHSFQWSWKILFLLSSSVIVIIVALYFHPESSTIPFFSLLASQQQNQLPERFNNETPFDFFDLKSDLQTKKIYLCLYFLQIPLD